MTREEAIKELKEYEDELDLEYATPFDKAILYAIKALSQEPCEKPMTVDEMEREYEKSKALFHKIVECDNTISRSDMLDAIGHGTTYTSEELQKIITNLPPVTQKSETVTEFADRCRECGKMRKGHWIHLRGDMYECSECGKIHTSFEIGECDADYCHNCGAKMESEEQTE